MTNNEVIVNQIPTMIYSIYLIGWHTLGAFPDERQQDTIGDVRNVAQLLVDFLHVALQAAPRNATGCGRRFDGPFID